jgi:hypothetical protein
VPRSLIHDWNGERASGLARRIELNDETLRDGLQSPSVTILSSKQAPFSCT